MPFSPEARTTLRLLGFVNESGAWVDDDTDESWAYCGPHKSGGQNIVWVDAQRDGTFEVYNSWNAGDSTNPRTYKTEKRALVAAMEAVKDE